MLGILLVGLVAYWFTFKEFKGSVLYLLSLLVASIVAATLFSTSIFLDFAIVTIITYGIIPWLIIGPYILKASKEESRKLGLYTLGFAILLPLILIALGLSIITGVI